MAQRLAGVGSEAGDRLWRYGGACYKKLLHGETLFSQNLFSGPSKQFSNFHYFLFLIFFQEAAETLMFFPLSGSRNT